MRQEAELMSKEKKNKKQLLTELSKEKNETECVADLEMVACTFYGVAFSIIFSS